MRRGAFERFLVSQCQLTAALGHDLSIYLGMAQTNATQVAVHRTNMNFQYGGHFRVGTAPIDLD
ncbi:MAG: hypothetical protein ACLQOO_36545 [Terriglobia bacterium]